MSSDLERARRALDRARTDPVISAAIAAAPPLSDATLSRLRALIPPPPAEPIQLDGDLRETEASGS